MQYNSLSLTDYYEKTIIPMSSFTHPHDIPVLTALTDDQVADYLRRSPDFLVDKPALLADLNLPHNLDGKAVSLVERQVSVLRERNIDMRNRLHTLIENARNNDFLFEKTKRLVLSLLDNHQVDDCIDALFFGLQNEFDIQFSSLLLIKEHSYSSELANQQVQQFSLNEVEKNLPSVVNSPRAVCGQLSEAELSFVFGDHANVIGSTAIAPLKYGNTLMGVLAIGNRNPDYYCSSMNTLFLNYIADTLCRLLK